MVALSYAWVVFTIQLESCAKNLLCILKSSLKIEIDTFRDSNVWLLSELCLDRSLLQLLLSKKVIVRLMFPCLDKNKTKFPGLQGSQKAIISGNLWSQNKMLRNNGFSCVPENYGYQNLPLGPHRTKSRPR